MDQAQSLRDIMRATSGKVISRVHAAQVVSVSSAREGDGATFVAQAMARIARAGARTLLVDPRLRAGRIELEVEGYHTASERFVRQEMHAGEWDDYGFGTIILDAGSRLDEDRLSFHDPSYRSVVVLTPSEASFFQAYKHIKLLHTRAGVKKMDVVINRARDEREGLQTFTRLQEVASRFLAVDFVYGGAIREAASDEEKNSGTGARALFEPKFLLDLDTGHGPASDLRGVAKKLGLSAQ